MKPISMLLLLASCLLVQPALAGPVQVSSISESNAALSDGSRQRRQLFEKLKQQKNQMLETVKLQRELLDSCSQLALPSILKRSLEGFSRLTQRPEKSLNAPYRNKATEILSWPVSIQNRS